MVLQKNTLFSGSIKENLRWGNAGATDEELVHACKLACADEFITGFPNGYDTHIGRAAATFPAVRSSACASPALC